MNELGDKEIGGRKAFGFAFDQLGVHTEIWGDAETNRLLRIEGELGDSAEYLGRAALSGVPPARHAPESRVGAPS